MPKQTEKHEYISNPFKLIFKGFDKLFKHNQTMAIVILALTLLGSFGQGINFGFGNGSAGSASAASSSPSIAIILVILGAVGLIILVVGTVVATLFNGAVAWVVYKTTRQESTDFAETMQMAVKKFWTILAIEIIVFFKVLGGFLLFIVPGIRAALRYNFVMLPVFDENANASDAIKRAKMLTKDHLLEVFGMVVAAGIIPFVGPLLQYGGQVIMYPQLKQLKDKGGAKPPVHWLNYLGFVLFGLAIVFIGLIVLIVLAIFAK